MGEGEIERLPTTNTYKYIWSNMYVYTYTYTIVYFHGLHRLHT